MGDGGADQEGSRAGAPSPSRSRSAATGACLTPKQRRFALAYLQDPNAAAAYRAAYPKVKPATAETNGARLLRNARVRAFVEAGLKKLEAKKFLVVEKLEEELDAMAHFDPADMYGEDGKLLAIKSMPERTRKALAGFDEDALFEMVETGVGPRGGVQKERLQVGVTRKVKWHNKREAIELGFKRRGALIERVEHEVKTVSISINGISRS